MVDALSSEDSKQEKDLRISYHLSDGEHSVRTIADHVSVSRTSVSNYQKQWARMGLLEREHSRASFESVISLEEAGIEVPEIPQPDDDGTEDENTGQVESAKATTEPEVSD